MKIIADTHTHTISSGHAYSTVHENVVEASKKGIELIAITDHSPVVPGAANEIYFTNPFALPKQLYGVRVLFGVEVDIIDYEGNLGLGEKWLQKLDFGIVSMHEIVLECGTVEQNTKALIKAISNPYIHAIGHPDRPNYKINFEEVILAAKKYNKLIEVNTLSLHVKKAKNETIESTITIIELCKKHGVKICTGSDAHFCTNVGEFSEVEEILNATNFPEELILTTSKEKVLDFLREHGKNL